MVEDAVVCPSSPVVMENVEVTGVKLPISGWDVCFVISIVVSVDIGDGGTSDVTTCMLLALEEAEVSSLEVVNMDTSDPEGLWLTLEGDKVLSFPEVDVSCEMFSVSVCPLREEEGVVITAEIVLV